MKSSLTRSSRSLIFLFLALVSVLCILIYYYRSVSFANIDLMLKLQLAQSQRQTVEQRRDALERRMVSLESQKQTVEQRRDALERRMVSLETKNRFLEDDLINHKAINDRALSVASDLKNELRTEREKLYNTTITAKVGTGRIRLIRRYIWREQNSGIRPDKLYKIRDGKYSGAVHFYGSYNRYNDFQSKIFTEPKFYGL